MGEFQALGQANGGERYLREEKCLTVLCGGCGFAMTALHRRAPVCHTLACILYKYNTHTTL